MDLTPDTRRAGLPRRVPRLARGEPSRPGARTAATRSQFEFEREWQRKLHDGGWAGVSWPKEYGGRGATLIEQSIFGEELARAKAPRPANVLGLVMGGPVVIAHGTEEQKERFLEPILSAEEIWCQGFSEPESGLRPRLAEDQGGQGRTAAGGSPARRSGPPSPTRRSGACSSPAPTRDVPKHKGLTYFLMDMEQDEVEVRPLRQITGEAEFNELFIENAYVPDENVVGGGRQRLDGRDHDADERARRARRLGRARPLERARRADRAREGARRRRRPARPRQDRAPEDRDRGPAARRDAGADRDDEGRHPRARRARSRSCSGRRPTRR